MKTAHRRAAHAKRDTLPKWWVKPLTSDQMTRCKLAHWTTIDQFTSGRATETELWDLVYNGFMYAELMRLLKADGTQVCVHSACNYPEAQCQGTCGLLHRVNTHHLPDDRAAVVMGSTDEPPRVSRARLALNTWQLYRRSGCGLRESFRNALRAWRQRT